MEAEDADDYDDDGTDLTDLHSSVKSEFSLDDVIFCVPQIKTMKTLMGETEEMTEGMTENPKTDHRKIK